ncbi:adenosine deaminase AGSA [Phlebotomus papatasi]|uniref:adenosine deaminase AGSA n=1 Tax=Phlebotomus papatasi TaxID=29031 RepID=UPI0024846BF4|nr:adenosine deaminase AGSA [Phlebotomus papatasi]
MQESLVLFVLLVLFAILVKSRSVPEERFASFSRYEFTRNAIKEFEERIRLGAIFLNENETLANEIIMKHKTEEIQAGLNNSADFLASHHFFKVKDKIEESEVFKFIQKMPKGANLHGHSSAMVSLEWLLKNATYRPGVILYTDPNNVTKLTFRRPDPPTQWYYLADLRNSSGDIEAFDKWLESKLTLYTPTPETDYPDIDVVWTRFEHMFSTIHELLRYLPLFLDSYRQILQELADDNVMYTEFRSGFGDLYDDAGKTYDAVEQTELLINLVEDFKKENPNFFGAKAIVSGSRNQLLQGNMRDIEAFITLKERFPDFIVGFDVTAQEKNHNANFKFIEALQRLPRGTKFFFHAGETNWYGTNVDENLIDAILMNTTRIGHGYALLKHPYLLETVKKQRIGIEVNPISNQVLHLVSDLRNHPASFYLSQGLSVSISNDDPGFWSAKGLSYDYYYAFMAIAPANAGLETLKKFAWTSLE